MTRKKISQERKDFLRELEIKTILKDKKGKIWISGAGRIILMMRGEKPQKKWIEHYSKEKTAQDLWLFERKNNIWLVEINNKTGFIKNPYKKSKQKKRLKRKAKKRNEHT